MHVCTIIFWFTHQGYVAETIASAYQQSGNQESDCNDRRMTAEEELEDMEENEEEEDDEEVEVYETETDETETTETESDEDDSKKSPVGKNTFSILVQAYSKCKPLMCKVHVIHCFSAARIEIL